MYRIPGLAEVIVSRLLRDYYNDVQNALGDLMLDNINIDQLEDILWDLDSEYAEKIIRELSDETDA